jgi:hypothetical protein
LSSRIFGINKYIRSGRPGMQHWVGRARPGSVLAPAAAWNLRQGADWEKAFAFYQGLDEAKAVEDSAVAGVATRPRCVQWSSGDCGGFVLAEISPIC